MDKSLYIAMTGAVQNARGTAIHANNLANVNTMGFRSDYAQARAMPVYGETYASRVYAMEENPGTNFAYGTLVETGNELDVAVNGEGWIAVQTPDGGEAYTRAGEMKVDSLGILRNGNGLPVMGQGGPIALPPFERITIGQDGTISIQGAGANPGSLSQVDRIKLVNPDASQLYKGNDGLMRQRDGQAAPADAAVGVSAGFLEGSNVNSVEALTELISLSRQFELHVKMMKTAEENSEASARLLQMS
ncbi:Flagellar basal-body rod protein FlgF [gamma proteobacterium IMCC2047]|nr:Flagellar basal-body rod protein FlgF [gamma proteobacterium IMCC2047]